MEYDESATETCDAEGVPIVANDTVKVIHMDDGLLSHYVGQQAHVEWVQDVWPFCQVVLTFPDTDLAAMSTFSKWVRKVEA